MKLHPSNLDQPTPVGENVEVRSQPKAAKQGALRQRAASASFWSVGCHAASQLLRVAGNILLTRLLFPEAFGLMALVLTFMQGFEQLSNVGIRDAVIWHEDGDKQEFLDTAWTIGVIRGGLLWLCSVLTAWPIALFYEEPAILTILPVLGMVTFLRGFFSIRLLTCQRNLDAKTPAIIDLVSYVVQLVGTIAFAVQFRSVWALVIGNLMFPVAKIFLSHAFLQDPWSRFRINRDALNSTVHFAKWVFVAATLAFAANRVDRLLLGKLLPLDVLGVYSIAAGLAALPLALAQQLANFVLQPVFASSIRGKPGLLATRLRDGLGVVLPAAMVACVGLAFASYYFFHGFYDESYWDAGWMSQSLAVHVWFSIIYLIGERLLMAQGESRVVAGAKLVQLLVGGTAAVFGCIHLGVGGLIAGMIAGTVAGYAVLVPGLAYMGIHVQRRFIVYSASLVCFVGVSAWFPWEATGLSAPVRTAVVLLYEVVVVLGLLQMAYSRARAAMAGL